MRTRALTSGTETLFHASFSGIAATPQELLLYPQESDAVISVGGSDVIEVQEIVLHTDPAVGAVTVFFNDSAAVPANTGRFVARVGPGAFLQYVLDQPHRGVPGLKLYIANTLLVGLAGLIVRGTIWKP